MPLYYPQNYRNDDQRAEMLRLSAAGICIFCPEHLGDNPAQSVIARLSRWTITRNRYPYQGTREHLLLIPDEHVTDLVHLSEQTRNDFWPALDWAHRRHAPAHYGIGIRNGDMRFTGGTVEHLHVHFLVGDADDPQHQPVRMKFSSRPAP
jgi:ATP adenylyltransferase